MNESDLLNRLARVRDVPIQLVFEVARFDINLQQLQALGEGYIIEPPAEALNKVKVVIDGQVVANGEVVTRGQNYGIRIGQFCPLDEQAEAAS